MRTGRPAACATPAPSLSWSTTDGRKSTILEVDGMLGADGERFVAYRGDMKLPAWTSFDG